MSSSEECELQDLVKETLEKAGSLSKIRAELRASIFLALEDTGCFRGPNSKNEDLQNFAQNAEGALVLCLIQEFLEFFGLHFTRSVLDPELASYGVNCSWKSKMELMEQLNFSAEFNDGKKMPLIYHILQRFRNQRSDLPSSTSHSSNNQKTNSLWTNNKSSTPASASSNNAPMATITSKRSEVNERIFDEERRNTVPSQISSMSDDVEWTENVKSPLASGKDSFNFDLYKPNPSLLGDLPPLSTPTNTSKNSLKATNKSSKQMTKLKAMLVDSSCETSNPSNLTEDELLNSMDQEDISDSENLDEKLIRELLKE